MPRALFWACLLAVPAPFAFAASGGVDDIDLSAAVRQLETGDWSARIRTVHELEYLETDGIPALAFAAEDGDWQVRMAAVHALAPLGPKATPILKKILKNEPCPVVRLIALHDLGSQASDGEAEEQAISWMFSASGAQINSCRDQPAPGRAPWAATKGRRASSPPAAAAAAAPAPDRTSGPAEPDEEPLPESHEQVITADVPRPPRRPSARRPSPPAAPAAPTKDERYAELDAILDAPAAPRETLDAAPPVARRARRTSAAAPAMTAPARLAERAELSRRRTDAPQTLPRPAVATPIPEAAVEAPASFEAAGGKAPHDAVPDLLLTLKRGGAAARSRAADELGQYGAAASSAVPALIAALRDKSPRVRASASLALGNIGSGIDGVVPLLVKALKDKNLDVRYAATLALSRIATPAARAAFKKHIGEDARRAIEQRPAGTGAARP